MKLEAKFDGRVHVNITKESYYDNKCHVQYSVQNDIERLTQYYYSMTMSAQVISALNRDLFKLAEQYNEGARPNDLDLRWFLLDVLERMEVLK